MIKGKATIQIIDEKSGEMVREIHEEIMELRKKNFRR